MIGNTLAPAPASDREVATVSGLARLRPATREGRPRQTGPDPITHPVSGADHAIRRIRLTATGEPVAKGSGSKASVDDQHTSVDGCALEKGEVETDDPEGLAVWLREHDQEPEILKAARGYVAASASKQPEQRAVALSMIQRAIDQQPFGPSEEAAASAAAGSSRQAGSVGMRDLPPAEWWRLFIEGIRADPRATTHSNAAAADNDEGAHAAAAAAPASASSSMEGSRPSTPADPALQFDVDSSPGYYAAMRSAFEKWVLNSNKADLTADDYKSMHDDSTKDTLSKTSEATADKAATYMPISSAYAGKSVAPGSPDNNANFPLSDGKFPSLLGIKEMVGSGVLQLPQQAQYLDHAQSPWEGRLADVAAPYSEPRSAALAGAAPSMESPSGVEGLEMKDLLYAFLKDMRDTTPQAPNRATSHLGVVESGGAKLMIGTQRDPDKAAPAEIAKLFSNYYDKKREIDKATSTNGSQSAEHGDRAKRAAFRTQLNKSGPIVPPTFSSASATSASSSRPALAAAAAPSAAASSSASATASLNVSPDLSDARLLNVVELVRALHVGHYFTDGNGRTNTMLLLNRLLVDCAQTPAMMYRTDIFGGEFCLAELQDAVKQGQETFAEFARGGHAPSGDQLVRQ